MRFSRGKSLNKEGSVSVSGSRTWRSPATQTVPDPLLVTPLLDPVRRGHPGPALCCQDQRGRRDDGVPLLDHGGDGFRQGLERHVLFSYVLGGGRGGVVEEDEEGCGEVWVLK